MEREEKSLEKILEVVSGEKSLREKEMAMVKAKKDAIKEMKEKRRKAVIDKSVKLEKDPLQEKKVVQNIKLFEWEAPERYQVKFSDKNFLFIVALSLVLILLLAILRHYLMMASVIALLFLVYVSGVTKPVYIKNKITKRGIEIYDRLFEWYTLDSFYFCKKDGSSYYSLIIETKLNVPKVLFLLASEKDKDAIFLLLQDKLLYKDIRKQGRIDRITYGEYIPLEKV